MKSRVFIVTIIAICAITIVSFAGWFLWKPAPVLMQGEVAAKSYKISSQMPGRIDSLPVGRGDMVAKGQLLYRVSSKTVDAKLQQAEAVKRAASAQNVKVDNGARTQVIEQAYQMYQNSLAALELTQKSYDRIKRLYENGVVPAQTYDEVSTKLVAAHNTSLAAKAGYDMACEGAQKEDKIAAAALVQQAGGAVAEVVSFLDDASQFSPVDGEVASIIAEDGELVGAGFPVVTVVDMSDSWVVFNVRETMLSKFTKGRKFKAYVPALEKSYEFQVSYIAAMASYATWSATRTTGEFDVRTFEVHARPTMVEIPNLRTGMSVTVDLDKL